MKAQVVAVCAMLVAAASAGLLHSPLAVRAFLPATRAYSYSTYLNTAPASYSFAVHPQLGYQVPHALSPYQSYYPYFPPTAVYYPPPSPILGSQSYPSLPILPSYPAPAPGYPSPTPAPSHPAPAPPQQPAGDTDTAVVDAAPQQDYQPDRQQEQQHFPQGGPNEQTPGSNGQPASTFPSFPQFPQQLPNFPQFPQGQPSLPNFPQFPQQPDQPSFPQFPQQPADQPSFPQFPQQPADQPSIPQQPSDQFSQFPSSTPSSFPASGSSDQGLNDEDTISVESA